MNNVKAWKQALVNLRSANDAECRLEYLITCASYQIPGPAILKAYHDQLLLILARAFDKKTNLLAETELMRIVYLLRMHEQRKTWQHSLTNSGLPYTEMRCQYSASMVKWVIETFPDHLLPIDADSNREIFRQLSQAALPGIEFHHATQGKYNIWNRIKWLSGFYKDTRALQWLINLIDQQDWTTVLKDQLYDGLKIFVSWKLGNEKTGITFARLPVKSVFYTKPDKLITDPSAILKKKVSGPLNCSLEGKLSLLSTIRCCLAFYARETDPVSHADTEETFLYEMGDGLQIALTGMVKERKLALESYIGYMAFKNGIPLSYGGGWIWGHRCKIGINIFPPFRGKDSDKLFCQIMRLYFQVYNVRCFVVKPYQFGKGNPEGLKTGAFWFYYKLGFRPVNAEIRKIAELEYDKIKSTKKYRTPVSLLRKFTACNKEWKPEKTNHLFIDADKVSIAITEMIKKTFSGDRILAIKKSMGELKRFLGLKRLPNFKPVEKKVWGNWCLLFVCMPGTESWTRADRKKFQQILFLKAKGNELDFIRELQKHKKFWTSIQEMLKN